MSNRKNQNRNRPAAARAQAPKPASETEVVESVVGSTDAVEPTVTPDAHDSVEPESVRPDIEPEVAEKPLHERVVEALAAEGLAHLTVTYQGKKFVFPATMDDIGGDALDLISASNYVAALPLLLDPEQPPFGTVQSELGLMQWGLFKSLRPRRPQYLELFQQWNYSIGLTAGE